VTIDRLPPDRRLAKRLAREARVSARVRLQAEQAYARRVRRQAKKALQARRELPGELLLSAGAGLASLPLEGSLGVLAVAGSGVFGLKALRSVSRLRRPPPLPPSWHGQPQIAPPPPAGSAAFPAIRRLETVRDELRRLLPLVSPAGRGVAEQAWEAAGEADAALRWQAARLAAVEPHRGADDTLLQSLDDGVAAQERLLAAVAELVVASADPLAGDRLQDATDAVNGLAQGLRELR